ncbi:hypothetical protein ABLT15_26895 [Paraburkholderia tropica]|uniref:hypothetical protein n=1 Tax=Paraburkholderia tropica TaxID=92647 RepID=UPI0032B51998
MNTPILDTQTNSSELLIANAATIRKMEEALASGPSIAALRLARINLNQARELLEKIRDEGLTHAAEEERRRSARMVALG